MNCCSFATTWSISNHIQYIYTMVQHIPSHVCYAINYQRQVIYSPHTYTHARCTPTGNQYTHHRCFGLDLRYTYWISAHNKCITILWSRTNFQHLFPYRMKLSCEWCDCMWTCILYAIISKWWFLLRWARRYIACNWYSAMYVCVWSGQTKMSKGLGWKEAWRNNIRFSYSTREPTNAFSLHTVWLLPLLTQIQSIDECCTNYSISLICNTENNILNFSSWFIAYQWCNWGAKLAL